MNPAAFPSPGVVMSDDRQQGAYEGMTLRDYFAAAAMQALITGPERKDDHYEEEQNEATVVRAYIIADAMLKEREREE